MTDTTEKLLPCPFCGCDMPTLQPEYEANNRFRIRYWVIRCERCLTQMDRVTKALTIAAWNRRVVEKPKWTKETPKEEGWYLVDNPSRKRPCLVEVRLEMFNGEEVMKMLTDNWSTSGDLWCDGIWLKIDIPALPEKGEAE